MKSILQGYDVKSRLLCSFAASDSIAAALAEKGQNALQYANGRVYIPGVGSYAVREGGQGFFEALHSYDVLEISDNGVVRTLLDTCADDAVVFVTPKCNSNCLMCPSSNYSRKEGEAATVESLLETVRYFPTDVPHITVTGGEPFLLGEQLFSVFAYLKEHIGRAEYLVLTNGRIFCIDRYVARLTQTMPARTVLAIPLHGSNAALHDAITQSKGSFSQTLSGISKLLAAKVPVEVRVVVSRLNAADISHIADLIIQKLPSVYVVHFIGLEMLGNAALNSSAVWLPYQEAFLAAKEAIDKLHRAGISTALYNFPLCAVEGAYHSICKKSISDYKQNYPKACSRCAKQHLCGGVFAGSRRFAEADLTPFEGADTVC